MDTKTREDLLKGFGDLIEVAEMTVEQLAEKGAWHFIEEPLSEWLCIHKALVHDYSEEELRSNLVYWDFQTLFKEIRWYQLLFLAGNYPLLSRGLRYVWELLFRAHYADTYSTNHPNDPSAPGPTVAEKAHWLADREGRLNWNTVIQPTLQALLPGSEHAVIENLYHPLWNNLNECVHPSTNLRFRGILASSNVKDNFHEGWAIEVMQESCQIFDLIWLSVLRLFPRSWFTVQSFTEQRSFQSCPRTRAFLEQVRL
jgi:hypothetical protein